MELIKGLPVLVQIAGCLLSAVAVFILVAFNPPKKYKYLLAVIWCIGFIIGAPWLASVKPHYW